jgi:hypothetical protein
MKRIAHFAILAFAFLVMSTFTGCDQEIARTKSVDVKDDGTVKTKEKTVTQDADGGTTVTEETKTTKP